MEDPLASAVHSSGLSERERESDEGSGQRLIVDKLKGCRLGVSAQLSLDAWIFPFSPCESRSQSQPHCHG